MSLDRPKPRKRDPISKIDFRGKRAANGSVDKASKAGGWGKLGERLDAIEEKQLIQAAHIRDLGQLIKHQRKHIEALEARIGDLPGAPGPLNNHWYLIGDQRRRIAALEDILSKHAPAWVHPPAPLTMEERVAKYAEGCKQWADDAERQIAELNQLVEHNIIPRNPLRPKPPSRWRRLLGLAPKP